jgi:hypothetical protein
MPYTHCQSCRLPTFTAAAYSSRDQCPRCGTELARQPRRLFAVAHSKGPRGTSATDASRQVA